MVLFRRLSKSLMRLSRQVADPLSTEPLVLFDFKTPEDVDNNWRVSSDAVFGGCSSGQVSLVSCGTATTTTPSHLSFASDGVDQKNRREMETGTSEEGKDVESYCMRFEGIYSRTIDRERAHPQLKKSGFVSLTGKRLDLLDSYIDLECYKSLVYSIRVHPTQEEEHTKGERTFLANIRTDNWVIGGDGASEDIWQAVLHSSPSEQVDISTTTRRSHGDHQSFVDIEIPLSEFILTWRGRVVDTPVELGRTKITALGISLLGNEDQQEGPFCIDVLQIKALHECDDSNAQKSHSTTDLDSYGMVS